MLPYEGQISEEDVLGLVEYIKSTSDRTTPGIQEPYKPALRGATKMGQTGPRNATDLTNDNDSAPMTQSQQGGVPQR